MAKNGSVYGGACRIRTCDHLIKSLVFQFRKATDFIPFLFLLTTPFRVSDTPVHPSYGAVSGDSYAKVLPNWLAVSVKP